MSAVVIQWDIKAEGRNVGDVEKVELTSFVEALIAQGRVTVLEQDPLDEAPVVPEDPTVLEPAPIVGFNPEVAAPDAESVSS